MRAHWTRLALWLLVRGPRRGDPSSFLPCGVSASLAVATKDQTADFFIVRPVIAAATVQWQSALLARLRLTDSSTSYGLLSGAAEQP